MTNSTGDEISIAGNNDYNLVDLSDNSTLNYATNIVVPPGTYTKISFVYGFNEEDNMDGAYEDLNSANLELAWNDLVAVTTLCNLMVPLKVLVLERSCF